MSGSAQRDMRRRLRRWSSQLDALRQNELLDDAGLVSFAKNRGLGAYGLHRGDPSEFRRRGWLAADAADADRGPLFHPFRIYPLQMILRSSHQRMCVSVDADGKAHAVLAAELRAALPTPTQLRSAGRLWNETADLAILLEPLYWPVITRLRKGSFFDPAKYEAELSQYSQKALRLVAELDPEHWRGEHEKLRHAASWVDGNTELYLLLRLSDWKRRQKLKGDISQALWLRHIAEVIRLGFEKAHGVAWPEEDQGFGMWRKGARTRTYGSERPLDDSTQARQYAAFQFGLLTGSVVRWYVEGETEYHAVRYMLPDPPRLGIELFNLQGQIATGKNNTALKLATWLKQDLAFRRFSMISFDTDVPANVKVVGRQAKENRVVGMICANKPDFEFQNFTLDELVEVAARIDDAEGYSGHAVRDADWSGVSGGRAFEKRYREVSARRPPSLKGKAWGEALASYAIDHPNLHDNDDERPFRRAIWAAIRSRSASYDLQKERFRFDSATFESVDLDAAGLGSSSGS